MYELQIENFKCFENKVIKLNQLSVLAGANGNGKSTVIQAILFYRQTIEQCSTWEGKVKNQYSYTTANDRRVDLNGSYCLSLGTSDLLIARGNAVDLIAIDFSKNSNSLQIVYEVTGDQDLWLKPNEVNNNFETDNPFFNQEFYYLNAERLGPRINQKIKFYDFPNSGFQGEHVAQLIGDTSFSYKFSVDEKRRHSSSKSKRLEQQLNAWLNEIMPGVSISASYDPATHSAQIKVDNFYTKGNATIATNIGFGISYILPIIVTGLIAKENCIMVVENPEAHLHPSAQSKIGSFLAMVANAGVIVIIETHSDHLVNGIQLAASKEEIPYEKVTINFFSQDKEAKQPDIESISLTDSGQLTRWPVGFFDQSQKDFAELFKVKSSE